MPEGVNVLVEDDEATIEFVDQSLRGQGLGKLLKAGGPERVRKVTRPTVAYIVPESVARAAGFIDGEAPAAEPAPSKGYDDGLPDMDWSRKAIDDYAATLTPALDTTGEANKHDALNAITKAVKAGAKRPEAPAPA